MCFVPRAEGCGVDLYDGGFGKGIGPDEFIIGRMEEYANDTDFAGYTFRAPGEVAGFETEGAVFLVAAACADEMDTLGADSGLGWLTTFLKGSACCQTMSPPVHLWYSRTSFCGSMHALRR